MRYIAFIRAIMVGREGLHRQVILDIFEKAGARNAVSHLATGNVSFDLEPAGLVDLEDSVDGAMSEVVGRRIEVFVRTLDHLRSIDAEGVFGLAPFDEVRERLVTFFHLPPAFESFQVPGLVQKDRTAVLVVDGCDVFSVTREWEGQIGSPGGFFERESGQRMTTRAWSTIEKILAKHPEA